MFPKFNELVFEISSKYKSFKLIKKEDSKFMKFLFKVLFMKYWNPTFMEDFTTTILARVYMPKILIGTKTGYKVLRHELIHIQDCYKTGILPFMLSYIFLLPVGFTFRAYWEYRAYCESIKVTYELNGMVSNEYVDGIVTNFTGSNYLWMCPFKNFIEKKLFGYRNNLLKSNVIPQV